MRIGKNQFEEFPGSLIAIPSATNQDQYSLFRPQFAHLWTQIRLLARSLGAFRFLCSRNVEVTCFSLLEDFEHNDTPGERLS